MANGVRTNRLRCLLALTIGATLLLTISSPWQVLLSSQAAAPADRNIGRAGLAVRKHVPWSFGANAGIPSLPNTNPVNHARSESPLSSVRLGFEQMTGTEAGFVAHGLGVAYEVGPTGIQMAVAQAQPQTNVSVPVALPPAVSHAGVDRSALAKPGDLRLSSWERTNPASSLRACRQRPIRSCAVGLRFVGANGLAKESAEGELPGRTNYLIGNDKSKWRLGVVNYATVRYSDIYPNTDVTYYGNQDQFEYDLTLHPGADPDRIRMSVEGDAHPSIRNGDLLIRTPDGQVIERRPVAYQKTLAGKATVRAEYYMVGSGEIGVSVGLYNTSIPLVIDPVISYSGSFGGGLSPNVNSPYGIALDAEGNTYIVGFTIAEGFPIVPPRRVIQGFTNQFVAKVNASGTAFVYTTFFDDSEDGDAFGITVDSQGRRLSQAPISFLETLSFLGQVRP